MFRKYVFTSLCTLVLLQIPGQNLIKIGAAYDFEKESVFQTFSFDLNRTEKVDEKTDSRYVLYDKDDRYILPSTDVNLGEGVTVSENNVSAQLIMGKGWLGNAKKPFKGDLTTLTWNQFLEFNPTFNADKQFNEKLGYGQFKGGLEFVMSKHGKTSKVVRNQQSISTGLFTNLGYRYSKTYEKESFYGTGGIFIDWRFFVLSKSSVEKFVLKISGNYYFIGSDVKELTNEKFAGIVKPSLEWNIVKIKDFITLYLVATYKYGNDNPNYRYIHSLDLSFKLKY